MSSYSSDQSPSTTGASTTGGGDSRVYDDRSNLSLPTDDLNGAGQRRVQPYSTEVTRRRAEDSSASGSDYQGNDRSYG